MNWMLSYRSDSGRGCSEERSLIAARCLDLTINSGEQWTVVHTMRSASCLPQSGLALRDSQSHSCRALFVTMGGAYFVQGRGHGWPWLHGAAPQSECMATCHALQFRVPRLMRMHTFYSYRCSRLNALDCILASGCPELVWRCLLGCLPGSHTPAVAVVLQHQCVCETKECDMVCRWAAWGGIAALSPLDAAI
jgi:hypothetical protein